MKHMALFSATAMALAACRTTMSPTPSQFLLASLNGDSLPARYFTVTKDTAGREMTTEYRVTSGRLDLGPGAQFELALAYRTTARMAGSSDSTVATASRTWRGTFADSATTIELQTEGAESAPVRHLNRIGSGLAGVDELSRAYVWTSVP
jgi:hypothetical protein